MHRILADFYFFFQNNSPLPWCALHVQILVYHFADLVHFHTYICTAWISLRHAKGQIMSCQCVHHVEFYRGEATLGGLIVVLVIDYDIVCIETKQYNTVWKWSKAAAGK